MKRQAQKDAPARAAFGVRFEKTSARVYSDARSGAYLHRWPVLTKYALKGEAVLSLRHLTHLAPHFEQDLCR